MNSITFIGNEPCEQRINPGEYISLLMACSFREKVAQQRFNQLWTWPSRDRDTFPPCARSCVWTDRAGLTFLEERDLDSLYNADCFGYTFLSHVALVGKGIEFDAEMSLSVVAEPLNVHPAKRNTAPAKTNFVCQFSDSSFHDPSSLFNQQLANVLAKTYSGFFAGISKVVGPLRYEADCIANEFPD